MENGQVDPNPSCVLNTKAEYYVVAPNVNINGSGSDFQNARADFDGKIAALNVRIGRDNLVKNAQQTLFDAENARDSNPDGYQQARVSYYTLLQGNGWLTTEERRVRNAVEQDVQGYQERILSLSKRLDAQSQYSDIVRNTSERVLQAKDDLQFMVDSFSEQLDKINVQKEKQVREASERVLSSFEWIDVALNWAIVITLLFAIGIVGYRLYQKYQYFYGKQTVGELGV
jgi:uncharacterized membrane protein